KRIEAPGVALAQLCHRLESAVFAGQQILAVRGVQEVLRAAFDDAQAMIAQFQIGYDPRIQQTDSVGRDRVAKAGVKFRRDRGTAHHLAALDHPHPQSGHRQIGRAGEAVMPRTDDDGVGLCHVCFTLSFPDGPKDQAGTSYRRCGSASRLAFAGDGAVWSGQSGALLKFAGVSRVAAGVSMTSSESIVATGHRAAHRDRLVLTVYTASIFVSALLLFSVQPLFTKMVLPRLGGSPAVWSVAMVFFQSLLLAGYAYAHYLTQIRSRAVAVAVHLALLLIAWLTLPLSIAGGWGEPPTSGYAFWLLGLFAVSIGLPFFALAANNPLLQAWFVRTGHPQGPDPYFLYASSNIGSFLALLSYPVLLEPMLTLRAQNLLWSTGYGALIVLIAGCGWLLLTSPATAAVDRTAKDREAPPPPWALRARWIFLAAVPS